MMREMARHRSRKSRHPGALAWAGGALTATVLLVVLFRMTDLDLELQRLIYTPGNPDTHWQLAERQPWDWLYRFGTIPGVLLGLAALLAFTASFFRPFPPAWRFPALFIALVAFLGPGLIINIFGKGFLGRPRPDQVLQFGGLWEFRGAFEPGVPGRGRSFLCGHCSMGFLFMTLFFILRGWRGRLALAGAAVWGLLLGAARVVQGAHFTSDVLLCGTIMLALAAALSPLGRLDLAAWRRRVPLPAALSLAAALFLLGGGGYLFSSPVYEEYCFTWYGPDKTPPLDSDKNYHRKWLPGNGRVRVEAEAGDLFLSISGPRRPLAIRSLVRGFGLPNSDSTLEYRDENGGVTLVQRLKGFYAEVGGRHELELDPATVTVLDASLRRGEFVADLAGFTGRVLLRTARPLEKPPAGFSRSGTGYLRPGPGKGLELAVDAEKITIR